LGSFDKKKKIAKNLEGRTFSLCKIVLLLKINYAAYKVLSILTFHPLLTFTQMSQKLLCQNYRRNGREKTPVGNS